MLEIVEILQEEDKCLVHTWVRDVHANNVDLDRRSIVRRKLFYGQSAALFLGQALETVSTDVPTKWSGPRVVVLVAPPGLFRERVLSVIAECVVSTLMHVTTLEEFIKFASYMVDRTPTCSGSESQ